MVSFIRCPVRKMGMVIGVKLAIRLVASLAPFCFGTGGSTAGVGSFLYDCAAILASLPMTGLIKFPVGNMGMVIGVRLAIRLVANLALFRISTGGGAADVGCKV